MALSFCWVILPYLVSIRLARNEANQMQAPPASDIVHYGMNITVSKRKYRIHDNKTQGLVGERNPRGDFLSSWDAGDGNTPICQRRYIRSLSKMQADHGT